MVFRRTGCTTWSVQVPTRTGWVQRTTGTHDRPTAEQMEAMLRRIGPRGRREWDLLDAIEAQTLTMGEVFDAYQANALEALRTRLGDVDLAPHRAGWQRWLADRVRSETASRYDLHLTAFAPAGVALWRSQFEPGRIAGTLAALSVGAATKRKYFAAVSSFGDYLTALRVLPRNPCGDVSPPPAPAPRPVEIELADVLRIVQGAPAPLRSVLAVLYGAGVEISAALALKARHVDAAHHELRAPGTKTHNRDRVVVVAEWAWPMVAEALAGKTPHALLFPGLDRFRVGKLHAALLRELQLPHHKLHAARHFWTIRAVKAGWPVEAVARQLGHANGTMVLRVYGRFVPRQDERRRWEDLATARDQADLAAGAVSGAVLRLAPSPHPTKGA